MKNPFMNERLPKIKQLLSAFATFAFALYNGILGIIHQASWNVAIFVYYLLLLLLKAFLLFFSDKSRFDGQERTRAAYIASFIFLLGLNLSLIWPAVLLLTNSKAIHADKITSIATATFVFANLLVSIMNLRKESHSENLLRKQLRLLGFINSLVSMMVLQNTLINVYGSYEGRICVLSAITTFAFLAAILLAIVVSFARNASKRKEEEIQ